MSSTLFKYFLLALAANFAFANKKSIACRKELEEIVFQPPSCAYEYMKRIGDELRSQSAVFWENSEQSKSLIETFSNTYKVTVVIIDAMGGTMRYPGGAMIPVSFKTRGLARSRLNIDGFNAFETASVDLQYEYTSIFWGPDGQMYSVLIALFKENLPEYC